MLAPHNFSVCVYLPPIYILFHQVLVWIGSTPQKDFHLRTKASCPFLWFLFPNILLSFIPILTFQALWLTQTLEEAQQPSGMLTTNGHTNKQPRAMAAAHKALLHNSPILIAQSCHNPHAMAQWSPAHTLPQSPSLLLPPWHVQGKVLSASNSFSISNNSNFRQVNSLFRAAVKQWKISFRKPLI